jgi:hypothetical protein
MNANEMNRTLAGLKNDPNYTRGLGDIYSIVRNASLGPLGVWLFGEMQPDETVAPGQIDKVTPSIGAGITSGLSNGITLAIAGAAVYFLFLRRI